LLSVRRPLGSTPFPYTPLFRSLGQRPTRAGEPGRFRPAPGGCRRAANTVGRPDGRGRRAPAGDRGGTDGAGVEPAPSRPTGPHVRPEADATRPPTTAAVIVGAMWWPWQPVRANDHSGGLRHRGHVEIGNAQGRHRRTGEVVAPLTAERRNR